MPVTLICLEEFYWRGSYPSRVQFCWWVILVILWSSHVFRPGSSPSQGLSLYMSRLPKSALSWRDYLLLLSQSRRPPPQVPDALYRHFSPQLLFFLSFCLWLLEWIRAPEDQKSRVEKLLPLMSSLRATESPSLCPALLCSLIYNKSQEGKGPISLQHGQSTTGGRTEEGDLENLHGGKWRSTKL